MIKPSSAALLLLALPWAAFAEGSSPWLPIPGQLSASLGYSQQSAKNAYIGDNKMTMSAITMGAASRYERSTTSLRLDYGLSDAVALDINLGVGRVKAGAADTDSGMTDAVAGVRWRVLDEYERVNLPTLTLRAAAIVAGNYEGDRLASLGNGANGLELAIVLGKHLTPRWSLSAEAGVQTRDDDVPNASFFELGTRYSFAPRWTASAGYAVKKYGGDLDIGAPGFTPARFQQVREERETLKLGLGYTLAGNQGLAVTYSHLLDGRNTVEDRGGAISYTYGF